MAIEYPKYLPLAQRDGYAFSATNNIVRTEMQSGRARQRVEFEDVPDQLNVKWFFNSSQASLFDAWVKLVGASYFEMTIVTPLGFDKAIMRFIERPQSSELRGRYDWQYSAMLEIEDKPGLDPDWLILPEYVLFADMFDIAVNSLLPLNKYQIYIATVDSALNTEWPQP